MSLPDYAYTFTNIEAVNENRAKKRVIDSLMRHYENADPNIYIDETPEYDISFLEKNILDIANKMESLESYIVTVKRQGNFFTEFVNANAYISFKKTLLQVKTIVQILIPKIEELKKNISYVKIEDVKKIEDMLNIINNTFSILVRLLYYNRITSGNTFQLTNSEKNSVNDLIAETLQTILKKELVIPLKDILNSYNERRKNLYTKKELKEYKKEGGYYSTDDYKIDEYI
jgi:hypothetical protein